MKAIRYGAGEAEEAVWSRIPGFAGSFLRTARELEHEFGGTVPCDCCMGLLPSVCEEVALHTIDLMKDSLKVELKERNIPPQLAELLPWNVCDQLKHLPLDTLEAKQSPPKSGKWHHPDGKHRNSLCSSISSDPVIEYENDNESNGFR